MSDPEPKNNDPKKTLADIPKPKSYHITDPFQDRGLWCFWLSADDEVLEYISSLNAILQPSYGSPFQRRLRGRVMFAINPRYDHEETWLWINELLETEATVVELNEDWESAIEEAHTNETGDSS